MSVRFVGGSVALALLGCAGGAPLPTPDVEVGHLGEPAFTVPAEIRGFGVSPDGKLAAVGFFYAGPQVFGPDGALVHDDGADLSPADVALWSPDATRLVVASADANARIVDTTTWKTLHTIPLPLGALSGAMRHDGAGAAIGTSVSGELALIDLATGALREVHVSDGAASAVVFSNDDRRLFVGAGPEVHVVDPATGAVTARWKGHTGDVAALALSDDGATLYSGGWDGVIRAWDTGSGATKATFPKDTDVVFDLVWAGGKLFAAGSDKLVRVYGPDGVSKGRLETLDVPNGLAAGGGTLFVGGAQSLHRFEVDALLPVGSGSGHAGRVTGVAWRDDQNLISVGADGTLRLWEVTTAQAKLGELGAAAVALSVAGDRAAILSDDGNVAIWDLPSRMRVATYTGVTSMPAAVAIAPDGAVAAGGWDPVLYRWDAAGRPVPTPAGAWGNIEALAYSPDGTRLAAPLEGTTLHVWTGEADGLALPAAPAKLISAAFSPDGARVAAGDFDGDVRIYDAAVGGAPVTVHVDGPARGLAWRSDGGLIAASAAENTSIWLFDPTTGLPAGVLAPPVACGALAFAPDGRLAAGCDDGRIRLFGPPKR